MKNALILHGLGNTSKGNWFPWLQNELKEKGWHVWVPDLPSKDRPNIDFNLNYILGSWEFNEESIIIGHSAGAVTALGILQNLPEDSVIANTILVSSFYKDIGIPNLRDIYIPFDFAKIKSRSKKFVMLQSDNDPYIPLDQPKYIAEKLATPLVIRPGEKHFNLKAGPQYTKLPFILSYID